MGVISIDLGSSSARLMYVENKAGNFCITEVARLTHSAQLQDGRLVWDIDRLFSGIITALDKAISEYSPKSIGICSWGVDYGVIGADGRLIDSPRCYRDPKNMDAYLDFHPKVMTEIELFSASAIYPNHINTLYQLYSDKMLQRYNGDVTIVMIADLLAYFLTKELRIEASNASTTGLLGKDGISWNLELIKAAGLDYSIFPKIILSGEVYGSYRCVPVMAVATHDTGSAVASMGDMDTQTAFLATGSWMLLGKLIDTPIVSHAAFMGLYTSERGYKNKVTLLNNINGLFLIQQLTKENNLDYKEVDCCMSKAKVLGTINVDLLTSVPNMTLAIKAQLGIADTEEVEVMDIIKTAYYSLAVRIKTAIMNLEKIVGTTISVLVMTGGATKAPYFMETLDALCGLKITIGHPEGAIVGNARIQFENS